ncbi:MAG TPA: proteasome subunit beta [Actinomycetota bacterium]|jgi:proteasome beta subunit|nr:proteasome subunit beta [Actinomycetota bacterium]
MTARSEGDAGRLASSFTDFLRTERPDLLPQPFIGPVETTMATTILAVRHAGGVVMAGDRRATEGMTIAQRDIEKVFPTDSHSAIAIAGVAGPATELVRLFQTELEFYEKVEGEALSLAGKANHLGRLIRANLPAAMQGLVIVPIFAGFDTRRGEGRIYRYDVTGGQSEETDYHGTGSGGRDAKNSLKKLYTTAADIDRARAVEMAVEALADAAEEDAATAGPDPVHGIYPTVYSIGAEGVAPVDDATVERVSRDVLDRRTRR